MKRCCLNYLCVSKDKKTIASLQLELANQNANNDNLKSQKSNLTAAKADLQIQVANLQGQLDKRTIASLEADKVNLNAVIADLKSQCNQSPDANSNNLQIQKDKKTIASLQNQLDSQNAISQSLESQVTKLEAQLSKLASSTRNPTDVDSNPKVKQDAKTISDLQSQVTNCLADQNMKNAVISSQQVQLNHLNTTISNLQVTISKNKFKRCQRRSSCQIN